MFAIPAHIRRIGSLPSPTSTSALLFGHIDRMLGILASDTPLGRMGADAAAFAGPGGALESKMLGVFEALQAHVSGIVDVLNRRAGPEGSSVANQLDFTPMK
jgi:hypothetical protein